MNRWKAAGSHLALSILVIGGIATAAFVLWYPHGLYKVAGLDRILLVMLGIDLTAGPLLTLILYRPEKWGLKFDLTVVAIAQLAFLVYGLNTLKEGRPVFLVGTPETFTVVFASEIDPADLAQASKPEWRQLSWIGPRLVAAQMPEDPEKRHLVMEEFMAGGPGLERSPKYYESYDTVAADILRAASRASEAGPDGLTLEHPIASRRGEGWVQLDPQTARPDRIRATP